ncbi:MAG TPA: hypothetical protein ENI87_14285 [bacterium]|nr:hypothetical protein [bacterium]
MRAPLLSFLLVAASAVCQGGEPGGQEPRQPDPEAVLQEMMASFRKQGIVIDAKARTVTVPVVVNQPADPIEYLLIHRRGKKHEAVFWTEAKPSVLNAALLMIGLQKGTNATYEEKQPPPTIEEIERGADPLIVTPPKGVPFYMTVKWRTPAGKDVECCVEDLLLDLTTQQPVGECAWVYLGGRMAQLYKGEPEVYIADFEGNLVSVCYLTPDNHLATMVHERARDDQNWWTTDLLPEPGTEMQFVFHKVEPALHKERVKKLRAQRPDREKPRKAGTKQDAPGRARKRR